MGISSVQKMRICYAVWRSKSCNDLEAAHVREALQRARSIEEQIRATYGSLQGGIQKDVTEAQRQSMGYCHWNEHPDAGSFPGGYG